MRLAYYNCLYSCPGRSVVDNLAVHWHHRRRNYAPVEKRAVIANTIDTVRQANADLLVLSEVLGERQRDEFKRVLEGEGYTYFHTGKGHPLHSDYGCVEMLVATRHESLSVFEPNLDLPAKMGYGGGMVGVEMMDGGLYVLTVHLPLPDNRRGNLKEFYRQIELVKAEIQRIQTGNPHAKIVLMGDFNVTHQKFMELVPDLSDFSKLSSDGPTCSTTQVLSWFYSQSVDYILGHKVSASGMGLIDGHSDHRLVWSDLVI